MNEWRGKKKVWWQCPNLQFSTAAVQHSKLWVCCGWFVGGCWGCCWCLFLFIWKRKRVSEWGGAIPKEKGDIMCKDTPTHRQIHTEKHTHVHMYKQINKKKHRFFFLKKCTQMSIYTVERREREDRWNNHRCTSHHTASWHTVHRTQSRTQVYILVYMYV